MLSASAFGLADNTYLDLDYSGYHKNLIQYCLLFAVQDHFRSILGIICRLGEDLLQLGIIYDTNRSHVTTDVISCNYTTTVIRCRNLYSE